ncbi:MAG: hypothetical protein ACR2GC_07990 [Methyloceanibacter sp.]|uniref:hypothetical protein n=1 Tax=Methyloceanibacter sp. TaxID=1965321 RepID=UPI003D9BE809
MGARLLIIAIMTLSVGCTAAPAGAEDGPLSPIVVTPVPQQAIVPVKGSDGRYHVLYELQLTNTLDAGADLSAVEVIDEANRETLLKLDADDIVKGAYLHRLDRQIAPDTMFGPFQSRVLLLNLNFTSKDAIPRALTHRFEISGPDPFTKAPGTFAAASPSPRSSATMSRWRFPAA